MKQGERSLATNSYESHDNERYARPRKPPLFPPSLLDSNSYSRCIVIRRYCEWEHDSLLHAGRPSKDYFLTRLTLILARLLAPIKSMHLLVLFRLHFLISLFSLNLQSHDLLIQMSTNDGDQDDELQNLLKYYADLHISQV